MDESYVKVVRSFTRSSLWRMNDKATKCMWVTMLVIANQHGEVLSSIPGLAHEAGVTIAEAEKALAIFESPDAYSRTKDFEGRRIEPIPGGWRLLTHTVHRSTKSIESRRESDRERKRRQRGLSETNPEPAAKTRSPCPKGLTAKEWSDCKRVLGELDRERLRVGVVTRKSTTSANRANCLHIVKRLRDGVDVERLAAAVRAQAWAIQSPNHPDEPGWLNASTPFRDGNWARRENLIEEFEAANGKVPAAKRGPRDPAAAVDARFVAGTGGM